MKCRGCLFYRPDGDGLGICAILDLVWGKGSGSSCIFTHNTVFVMGPDFGCIHAESRNLTRPDIVGNGVIQHLIEAIGRHPAAEAAADVADAINAIDDALKALWAHIEELKPYFILHKIRAGEFEDIGNKEAG